MNSFKKVLSVILVAVMVLGLASCGKKDGFKYSEGLDKNGYWEGVKASEYVKLGDYKNITITKAEINNEIEHFLLAYPEYQPSYDRQVEVGDHVNIDYVGSINGVEFEGGNTMGQGQDVIIGETQFIDDFLDQLVGHMPGETVNVEVTFPSSYSQNPDLQDKDALFVTTINYVGEPVRGIWNDKYVQSSLSETYGWTTTAEAEATIFSTLVDEKLYDTAEITKEVPQAMVDWQINSMVQMYTEYAESYGITFDEFLQYNGMGTLADFKASVNDACKNNAECALISQAIAEQEKFSISDSDIKDFLDKQVENGSEHYKDYVNKLGKPYLKYLIISDKIKELVDAGAKIVE